MSCLQNEALLESLYDEVWEEFRIANKLTDDQMYELEQSNSGGTFDQLVSTTNQRFEAMCQ